MAKTGLPNFQMRYSGPWRGITKTQSWASSHSGSKFTTNSDIEAFLISFWEVMVTFMYAASSGPAEAYWVSKVAYYDGTNSAALYEQEYTTQADAIAAGYTLTGKGTSLNLGDDPTPPETCILLEAPIGLSKTGKPVTMKKYIHWTQGLGTTPSFISPQAADNAALLGNGGLYGSRVLTSPHGAQGSWVPYAYFSNHQMERRRKKSGGSGVDLTTSLAAKVLQALGDLVPDL